jgi:hypothetical protein
MTLVAAFLLLPAMAGAADVKLPTPTAEERNESIRHARVWEPTDVAAKDLYNGPKGELSFAVDEEVTCDFVPKLMSGLTEKFLCKLEDGRIFKVKYNDGSRFKEAIGEVLGTRMFWALGFYADTMRAVRVTCRNCQRHPWTYVREKKNKQRLDENGELGPLPPEAEVGTYTIDPAAIEEKLDADAIEREKDQGWWWSSLDDVDESAGGASRAQLDALKLLMAFVQNSDNKSRQNTLACLRDDIVEDETGRVTCRRPIMYVDDIGSVFGEGGFITGYEGRVDYEGWKKRRVWRNSKTCRARLVGIGGIFRPSNLRNPKIGEGGRALLAGELEQLSDAQIADLFRASRIDSLHETMRDDHGGRREVTIDDWVQLFKKKREEITSHPACEEP